MDQRLRRISFCLVAFIVLVATSLGAASFAATTVGQDDTSMNRSARRHTHRHGERSIIFVGGRKRRHGAASRSNPRLARRSRGALNPQPIPPGKHGQP